MTTTTSATLSCGACGARIVPTPPAIPEQPADLIGQATAEVVRSLERLASALVTDEVRFRASLTVAAMATAMRTHERPDLDQAITELGLPRDATIALQADGSVERIAAELAVSRGMDAAAGLVGPGQLPQVPAATDLEASRSALESVAKLLEAGGYQSQGHGLRGFACALLGDEEPSHDTPAHEAGRGAAADLGIKGAADWVRRR